MTISGDRPSLPVDREIISPFLGCVTVWSFGGGSRDDEWTGDVEGDTAWPTSLGNLPPHWNVGLGVNTPLHYRAFLKLFTFEVFILFQYPGWRWNHVRQSALTLPHIACVFINILISIALSLRLRIIQQFNCLPVSHSVWTALHDTSFCSWISTSPLSLRCKHDVRAETFHLRNR